MNPSMFCLDTRCSMLERSPLRRIRFLQKRKIEYREALVKPAIYWQNLRYWTSN